MSLELVIKNNFVIYYGKLNSEDFNYHINFNSLTFHCNMRNDKENIIVDKSYAFALKIVRFTEELNIQKRFVIASQLLKSGTSIGANVREAQNAESNKDFIHKMKVAAKEADETIYWLEISSAMGYDVSELLNDCNEIQRILSKIISTSKGKGNA